MPATEEQGHYERGDQHYADVFAHEEETPFHARVLDVITVGELLLGLRLVKRVTVGDGDAGKQEGNEAQYLGHHVPQAGLGLDYVSQVEAAGLDHYPHQGEPQEHFIGEGLGRGAQAAEQ